MTCEHPSGCDGVDNGFAPLAKGMTVVDDFEPSGAAAPGPASAASPAPAAGAFVSLPQDAEETMSFQVTTAVSVPGFDEPEVEHVTITLPLDNGC
jgi:hypothetical protein